jgi:hypothetical protein
MTSKTKPRGGSTHGESLAFMHGLLEQDGRKLLSYSATIKLRQR